MLKQHAQFFISLWVFIDFAATVLAWMAAYVLRFHLLPDYPNPVQISPDWNYLKMILPMGVGWLLAAKSFGLFKPRRVVSDLEEVYVIVKVMTLTLFICIAIFYLLRWPFISRLFLLLFWGLSIVFVFLVRWVRRLFFNAMRRKGYNVRMVLIVGAGNLGKITAQKIDDNSWTGLRVVGFLDNEVSQGTIIDGVPVLGQVLDIRRVMSEEEIDQVFIALSAKAYEDRRRLLEILANETVTTCLIPDIYQAVTLNASVEDLDGLPIINLSDSPTHGWNWVMKRLVDIVFSIIILSLCSLLMAIIAVAIKITSPGSIIFKQRRHGLRGKVICVYKFRTMKVLEDGKNIVQATENDPRLTKVGAFLRRTSLDELPQFFNVLQGTMSIVGPRPHAIAHDEYYRLRIKSYMLRNKVKPGITGWAQVNGLRGETATLEKMESRIEYDLYYLEHWSLWLDLKIIFMTPWKILSHETAY